MNRLILFLALLALGCSQKVSEPIFESTDDGQLVQALRNTVGVPITGNFYTACDTITNEVIWVDIINSKTCDCLTQNGSEFEPRECDNVAPCQDVEKRIEVVEECRNGMIFNVAYEVTDEGEFTELSTLETGLTCGVEKGCTENIITVACDDNNSVIGAEFTNGISMVQIVCSDGTSSVEYFTGYGTESQEAYELQGTFVNCASGQPVPEPEPELPTCQDWEIISAYAPTGAAQGVNVEVYEAIEGVTTAAGTTAGDVWTGAPDASGLPTTSGALINSFTDSNLRIVDGNNGRDAMRAWTYILVPQGLTVDLREIRGTAETNEYWLDECCSGTLVSVAECPYACTGGSPGIVYTALQSGIHKIGVTTFDWGVWSGYDFEYAVTGTNEFSNVPASWLYQTKPSIEQCRVKVCPETNVFMNFRDEVLAIDDTCVPTLCSGDPAVNDLGPRVEALESKIDRECVQLFAEDSGATGPTLFDYSLGNGNELSAAAYGNWGIIAPYNGEIVAYGITRDDPGATVQDVAITLDGAQVFNAAIPANQDEIILTGLNIPVTAGQVINWQTVSGTSPDVVPTAIVCYEID